MSHKRQLVLGLSRISAVASCRKIRTQRFRNWIRGGREIFEARAKSRDQEQNKKKRFDPKAEAKAESRGEGRDSRRRPKPSELVWGRRDSNSKEHHFHRLPKPQWVTSYYREKARLHYLGGPSRKKQSPRLDPRLTYMELTRGLSR